METQEKSDSLAQMIDLTEKKETNMKKQYTKKQITEAIAYWEKQLNESQAQISDYYDNMTQVKQTIETILKKFGNIPVVKQTANELLTEVIPEDDYMEAFGMKCFQLLVGIAQNFNESVQESSSSKIDDKLLKDMKIRELEALKTKIDEMIKDKKASLS